MITIYKVELRRRYAEGRFDHMDLPNGNYFTSEDMAERAAENYLALAEEIYYTEIITTPIAVYESANHHREIYLDEQKERAWTKLTRAEKVGLGLTEPMT